MCQALFQEPLKKRGSKNEKITSCSRVKIRGKNDDGLCRRIKKMAEEKSRIGHRYGKKESPESLQLPRKNLHLYRENSPSP